MVDKVVEIAARSIGPEFEFVVVVRAGDQLSYVLRARVGMRP